ncbi:MAG: peptidoglycan-binding domain-containing protein, partial [Minisyncoccia bacterium]
SQGEDVKQLQTALVQKGYLTSSGITGFYGNFTRIAVQKYQCDQQIVCSGTAASTGYGTLGPQTRARLMGTSSQTPSTTTTTTTTYTPPAPPSPSSSSLSSAQIAAILAILQAFGADAAVIAQVRGALGG